MVGLSFTYDDSDGSAILFAVLIEKDTLKKAVTNLIQAHGGVVVHDLNVAKAAFCVLSPGTPVPMHLAPLAAQGSGVFVQALWIWQCVTEDLIVPWYTYEIHQPGGNDPISDNERDLMELTQGVGRYLPTFASMDTIYLLLNRKFPHLTVAKLRNLYEQNQVLLANDPPVAMQGIGGGAGPIPDQEGKPGHLKQPQTIEVNGRTSVREDMIPDVQDFYVSPPASPGLLNNLNMPISDLNRPQVSHNPPNAPAGIPITSTRDTAVTRPKTISIRPRPDEEPAIDPPSYALPKTPRKRGRPPKVKPTHAGTDGVADPQPIRAPSPTATIDSLPYQPPGKRPRNEVAHPNGPPGENTRPRRGGDGDGAWRWNKRRKGWKWVPRVALPSNRASVLLTAVQSKRRYRKELTSGTSTGVLATNEQAVQRDETETGLANTETSAITSLRPELPANADELPPTQRRALPKRGQGTSNWKWVDFSDGGSGWIYPDE